MSSLGKVNENSRIIMRSVTRDEIVKVWDEICDMDDKKTESLVKQFMNEQPALGIFLFAKTQDLEGGTEQSRSIDLSMAAWQALTKVAGRRLKSVTPEQIEKAEEANTSALERLDEASEIEWQDTVQSSFQNYNQHELLGFAIEVLMSGHEDNPELAPESIGMEMLWIKTVVDCLDQTVK
jgi:hypothetical protein